jgi:Fic family protein
MSYDPKFTVTPHFLKILEEINSFHTRIQTATVRVGWIPALQQDILAREAHGSTAIEGNPLTLEEVKTVLEGKNPPTASPRSVQEIRNYAEVMHYIQSHSETKAIRESDLLRIHALLGQKNALERGPFGQYRTYGVRVGSHIAPDFKEVPSLMRDLFDWVNGEGRRWPAVVSSAILHFRFEYIHPFGDGNGRSGRAMAVWELYRRRFDAQHIFAIDEIFWENRRLYYAALARIERDSTQDLTGWIEFVGEALATALERTWKRVEALEAGKKRKPLTLTPNQERLIAILRQKPMGIAEIQRALKVTKPGAHYLLKPLLQAKWIQREGGHKTGVYRIVS